MTYLNKDFKKLTVLDYNKSYPNSTSTQSKRDYMKLEINTLQYITVYKKKLKY